MGIRRAAGFTLVELMIAGAISLIVVVFAFASLTRAQRTASLQERTIDLSSQGRLALDLIGRDIRSAGDSVQLLPAHCLGAAASAGAPFGCPAVLEAHPWRLILARYMWDPGADGIHFTADDVLTDDFFEDNPLNVVAYEFVPRQMVSAPKLGLSGFLGRIDRIVNPFGFRGEDPARQTILDNVVLDNRMAVSPDGSQTDPRRNHALFMYRLLSIRSGEYQGEAAFTQRATRVGSFILPPVRFYAIPAMTPIPWEKNPPYLPNHTVQIVGLRPDGSTVPGLRPGKTFAEDMRYILDYNRIRAILVSFKLVEQREDPDYPDGIDLDPSEPGTARLVQLESTFELKVFSGYLY